MEENIRQKNERSFWDRMADQYDRNTEKTYRSAYQESIDRTARQLSKSDRVLEIGCGTGIISLGISGHALSVTGVDISPRMIEMAKAKALSEKITNVDFQTYDGYSLPFGDNSFDRVLLFNLLHIVKEPDSILKESRRLLKPGGLLVSATDCYAEPAAFINRVMLVIEKIMKTLGFIPYLSFFRKMDVDSLLKSNGFTIMETADLHPSPVNYYVMAKKELNHAGSGQ